jgi:hypothetical protein
MLRFYQQLFWSTGQQNTSLGTYTLPHLQGIIKLDDDTLCENTYMRHHKLTAAWRSLHCNHV